MATVEKTINIKWNTANDVLYWYRVESECEEAGCDTTGVEPNDPKCGTGDVDGTKQLVIVAARGLDDLCFKLKQGTGTGAHRRPFKGTIKSVKRYSRPVRTTDYEVVTGTSVGERPPGPTTAPEFHTGTGSVASYQTNSTDAPEALSLEVQGDGSLAVTNTETGTVPIQHSDQLGILAPDVCQELIEEDITSILECGEFNLTSDDVTSIGFSTRVTTVFITSEEVDAGGTITMGGCADIVFPEFTEGGTITIGGAADFTASHYEYEGGGEIVMGGEATYVSPNWNYEGSGDIIIGGTARMRSSHYSYCSVIDYGEFNCAFSYAYDSCNGSIVLGGAAEYEVPDFAHIASGGIVIGGEADAYVQDVEGSGGIVMGGEGTAVSDAYAFESSGGVVMGGSVGGCVISPVWSWESSGGIVMGGSHFINGWWTAEGSGGIVMDGTSDAAADNPVEGSGGIIMGGEGEYVSSAWSFTGMGDVEMGGTFESSYLGLLTTDLGGDASVVDIGASYREPDNQVPITIADNTVSTVCGCNPMPLSLNLQHNINNNNVLSEFLSRNNYGLPSNLKLLYRTKGSTWTRSVHLTGAGSQAGVNDKWLLFFDWSCTNDIDGQEDLQELWKFCLFARRTVSSTNQDFDTRLVFTTNPASACGNIAELSVSLTINTITKAVTSNEVISLQTFVDEIGLFKGAYWRENPNLSLTVSVAQQPESGGSLDIQPIFPEPVPV